ncbi:MAG: hypothetical protein JXJ20_05545 [Anaerolineae bacterium]|nr:hypothetical protein [Anaerolineae bacterium]
MMKLMQTLDRKTGAFLKSVDRSMSEPVNAITTFEVFTHGTRCRAHQPQQTVEEPEQINQYEEQERAAPLPSVERCQPVRKFS